MKPPTAPRIFVTGFRGFGEFDENPSAALAASCGRDHALLEVTYDAADRFLSNLGHRRFDVLLMLGVSAHVASIQLERVAQNRIGQLPDVRGVVRGPATIHPDGPDSIESTLWTQPMCQSLGTACGINMNDDAGSYLCNYIYFRALRRFAQHRVGFLHVPPTQILSIESQRETLSRLIRLIERAADVGIDHLHPAMPA